MFKFIAKLFGASETVNTPAPEKTFPVEPLRGETKVVEVTQAPKAPVAKAAPLKAAAKKTAPAKKTATKTTTKPKKKK